MTNEEFLAGLQTLATECHGSLSSADGAWVVKGFVDVFRNLYAMPGDTKVVSKVIELMLFPAFARFAEAHELKMVLCREQNHYPDLSFVSKDGGRFAVDLKTTYRVDEATINTMTLGAFTGYFRERESTKNVTFPYGSYSGHFVFGVIYRRAAEIPREDAKFELGDLEKIPSAIRDLQFFAQPKYRIAKDQPGSGNTKNIGAITNIEKVINGTGYFAELGEAVFDDYWMFYLTRDMARAAELDAPPYSNLKSYLEYKKVPGKS
jgi:hypothetical protein